MWESREWRIVPIDGARSPATKDRQGSQVEGEREFERTGTTKVVS